MESKAFVINKSRELLVTIGKASNIFQMIANKECLEKTELFDKIKNVTLIGCCSQTIVHIWY